MTDSRCKKMIVFVLLLIGLGASGTQAAGPLAFTDDQGQHIILHQPPQRVVSLVPSITETIFRIGAADALQAVTYHGSCPSGRLKKKIVGGFFSPCVEQIRRAQPDVVFYSRYQKDVCRQLAGEDRILINLEVDSLDDSFKTILLIGKIFGKAEAAEQVVAQNQAALKIIEEKTAKIPYADKKRVLRLMGREGVMTPGDDSFQNEMIRAAGGIPPMLGKKGHVVPVTLAEWKAFNPEVIYGCGGDRDVAARFFSRPGWKDVEAVKNHQIYYFPCDLTCRAATHTGYFVSWLAASIYREAFSEQANQVLPEKVFDTRSLKIDLDYVNNIRIDSSHIHDFINKSLIVEFTAPMTVVSTLEGQRTGIRTIGNHYSSPPCWGIEHQTRLPDIRKRVYDVIGKKEDTTAFLFTGADMDHLSIQQKQFRDMRVYALVTAGVASNALRMSRDNGGYYEPGTINMIIMSNMRLTPRAMTRAIIAATEAKTAALMDMDIRSTYTGRIHQATGTGTDNMLIVQGTGQTIDNAGGHSKMGELIAKAVYKGVQDAIYRQNGYTPTRNVFQRLKERRISIMGLVGNIPCDGGVGKSDLGVALEKTLLDPRYAGFVESSFALSDAYEKGLISDLKGYDHLCRDMAQELAGKKLEHIAVQIAPNGIPLVLEKGFNALLTGLYVRMRQP